MLWALGVLFCYLCFGFGVPKVFCDFFLGLICGFFVCVCEFFFSSLVFYRGFFCFGFIFEFIFDARCVGVCLLFAP